MKTWTNFMLLVWLLLVLVITIPKQVLTDQHQYHATRGTMLTLRSSAVAVFESDSFFAVDASAEVIGAERKESGYVLELHGVKNDYWKVVKGSPSITITPEDGSSYFRISLLKSFSDWLSSAILLFFGVWCFWVLGIWLILQW